jgi:hypothetical protein
MSRFVIALFTFAALSGCYNPRYPSEVPGPEARPKETSNSQETSVRERERRDGAAGSGSSVGGY